MASWDFDEAIDFIFFAIQQEAEDKIEQRWIIHYQDQMSLEDFKAILSEGAETKPLPVIEADVAKIISMDWTV